ncbi:MAG: FAD-dependent oxidoreductase [Lachnospiraceae bacterium]|nr:FAD-dependent oxidoreductase [Lachnospiraceae bacterium]
MKEILIIGSGISGLTCAISLAEMGHRVTLASPFPSERAQSVMAAGGINAALDTKGEQDSVACHVADTLKGGCYIASPTAVQGLCAEAPAILRWLETLGTVFTRDANNRIDLRAFGGQTHRRTAYAGASTGKQIVTALVHEARKYECDGLIERRLGLHFHSGLIRDGHCYGALMYDEVKRVFEPIFADAVVMATGGQNALFGKTTGSTLCDGYAAGKLMTQGVTLKNLEFIQYHPTAIETPQKRMLITEGARGEGGRLYYLDGDQRVYFMEDKFGPRGNLMPRDVVAKCIYDVPTQVYLDVANLGADVIHGKLSEVDELCRRYLNLDVTKADIPVYPSVHYFMGGIAVDNHHRTNIESLYAIGECAAIYHGANRLGGNSLLGAIYSGKVAAGTIDTERVEDAASKSPFSAVYIRRDVARVMNECLGITRTEDKLLAGIEDIDHAIGVCEKIRFDSSVSPYQSYALKGLLPLARAVLTCALHRQESRGAHIREDYPETSDRFLCATIMRYNNGRYDVEFVKEV